MPFHRGTMAGGFLGTVPGPPGTPTATTCANTQSVLSWTAPTNNGGSAITDYVVQYSTSATFASSVTTFADGTTGSTGATVTGLSNGTPYYFRVAAVNTYGTGSYSGISTVITPATVPNAPTSVSGTSNANGESSVSWVAPSGAGTGGNGPPFTFTVQYSTSATFASAVTTFGTTSSSSPLIVNGLTNGTTYYFRVKAANCAGDSSYSSISAGAVPAAVPGAPGTAAITHGDTTDTFTWSQAASNGSEITAYRFQVTNDNGSTWYSNIGGTLNGYTEVAALSTALATQYRTDRWKVRASAVNGVGQGPYASGLAGEATIAWAFGGYTDSGTCASVACNCAACDCGTSTGTNTTRTGSRLCYRWTRSATSSTPGPLRNSDNSAACSGAYGSCTGGSCTSCTGCASYTSAPKTGTFTQGGIEYTYQGPPGTYYAFPNPNCSSGCDFGTAYYDITVCNGTNTITLTDAGLCYNVWGDPC